MLSTKSLSLALALLSIFQFAHAQDIRMTSCQDVQNIAHNLDGDYYLDNDIDCAGFNFKTISGTFTGSIDGQKHTISNLTTTAKANEYGGIFTKIERANISHLRFENVTVNAEDQVQRGLLSGFMAFTTVEDIIIRNLNIAPHSTYTSKQNGTNTGLSGGITGSSERSTFRNVQIHDLQVRHHTYTGGLVGMALGIRIEQSGVYNMISNLDPERDYPATENKIKYRYDKKPKVRFKYDTAMGGLIGFVQPTVYSYDDYHSVHILSSRTSGDIAGPLNIGGMIGIADQLSIVQINNSYSLMNVKSGLFAGGMMGRAGGKGHEYRPTRIDNAFAAGKVDAEKYARGIVGSKNEGGDGSHVRGSEVFFDNQTTGRIHSGMHHAKGLTTEQFKHGQVNTFKTANGWNEEIWSFAPNAYPILIWEEDL